jgi:hypothetical protein
MGAWYARPECGVPLRHYVNGKNGNAVAEACGTLNGVLVLAVAATLSVALALIHTFMRRPPNDEGVRAPLFPMWACALPLAAGVAVYSMAASSAAARYAVELASFDSSEMQKTEYIAYTAGERRTAATVGGALASSSIVSSAALLNGALARATS